MPLTEFKIKWIIRPSSHGNCFRSSKSEDQICDTKCRFTVSNTVLKTTPEHQE